MGIQATPSKLHWNYFLALENDLEVVSRYIEFSQSNFKTYSIELAHLLFAASSEVDVIAKSLCKLLNPTMPRHTINDYRLTITQGIPNLANEQVFIKRYGLTLTPWKNWQGNTNPLWWRSYNNVKHERNQYFPEATLKNALNALAGLLVVTFYYYKHLLPSTMNQVIANKDVMQELEPQSKLLKLSDEFYRGQLLSE
ncbi:MAG TPA: hypothetical protein VF527_02035 [Pyrinomonadaceae bacterium]|jgi:hypothetical protein